MSTVVNAAVAGTSNKLTRLQKFSQHFGEITDRAAIAGEGITSFFHSSLEAAEDNEVAVKRLEQVYKSMGQNVEQASKQSQDYAAKLEFQIGVEDEAIMAVQAKIATFSKVSDATARMNGLMDRATRASFDLAATGFGEAAGNAVMLGKALQDPARGAMALSKAGALNKADIPIIKQIQATKGLKAAQEFVKKAVEKQVGGVAAATVNKTKLMQTAWSEVKEAAGKAILPTFNAIAQKLLVVIPKIQAFIEEHPKLVKWVAAAGVGLLAFGVVGKTVSFVASSLSSAWKFAGMAFRFFGTTISTVTRFMMANPIILIISAIALAAYLIYNNWDKIKKWFIGLWDTVKGIFSKFWNWIKNLFLNYTPQGLIFKHWDKIKAWFSNLWNNIKQIFMDHVAWVMGLGARFYNAGKNIIMSIWNGIKAFVSKPIDAIKNMAEKIRKFLPFSPAKEGALRDIHKIRLVETIAENIKVKPVMDAMNRVSNSVFNAGGQRPQVAMAGTGGHVFHIQVNLNGGATQKDADTVSASIKKVVVQAMKEEQNRQARTKF